jgi:holo-[acyl-carrier protein] synthase
MLPEPAAGPDDWDRGHWDMGDRDMGDRDRGDRDREQHPPAAGRSPAPAPARFPRILIGTDIVGVERLSALLHQHPELRHRVFTARELSYCDSRARRGAEHLAARFAAKEAVGKALGTGIGTWMRWTDVEVVNAVGGRPQVRLHGQVATEAAQQQLQQIDISLAHTSGIAVAYVALVCAGGEEGT